MTEDLNTISTYNDDNIVHLDDREHIRRRPGMYIGKLGDGKHDEGGDLYRRGYDSVLGDKKSYYCQHKKEAVYSPCLHIVAWRCVFHISSVKAVIKTGIRTTSDS